MGYEDPNLADLVEQVKQASASLEAGDAKTNKRIDELTQSINALYLKHGRPGSWDTKDDDEISARKVGLCQNPRALTVPKIDTGVSDNYTPASAEIDEALSARGAMKALVRHGDTSRLDRLEKIAQSLRNSAIPKANCPNNAGQLGTGGFSPRT